MKMERTEWPETSAYKIQTSGNYPEESIQLKENFKISTDAIQQYEKQSRNIVRYLKVREALTWIKEDDILLTCLLSGCLLVCEYDNISHKLLHMRFILQPVLVRYWLHEVTL